MASPERRRKGLVLRLFSWANTLSARLHYWCILTFIVMLLFFITLRAKLSGTVYCNRSCLWVCVCVCVFVCVCLWVCYHDNSKLHVLIFINWLNFGCPAPPGRGSAEGRNLRPVIIFQRKELSASKLVQTFRTEPPCVRSTNWPLRGRGRWHVT